MTEPPREFIRDFIRARFDVDRTGVVVFEAAPGDHYCYAHLERILMDFEAWKRNQKESHDIP